MTGDCFCVDWGVLSDGAELRRERTDPSLLRAAGMSVPRNDANHAHEAGREKAVEKPTVRKALAVATRRRGWGGLKAGETPAPPA